MSTHSAGPHYVSCDECGRNTPKFKDMARLMASIRGWDFDRPSESHRCPDCGGTGAITRENSALEVETLRAQVKAARDVCEQQVRDRSPNSAYQLAAEKLYKALVIAVAEVETRRAQVKAARDVCEQQVRDRSPNSADRQFHTLDYIDGWNDALDIVEQALDGAR